MSKVSQSIIVIFLMICGAGIAGAEDRDSWISLHSYSFDVYGPSPVIPDHLRTISSDKSSEGYYLVKLPGPIQSANFQALSDRALKIYAYIPYYAYLVKLKNDHKRSLLAETGAIWLGEYHPAYKISRDIAAVTEKSDKDLYIVMVQIFPDADLAALEKQILALGVPRLEGSAANPYFSRIRLLLAPDEVVMLREQIALLRDVFWIDIEPRKALLNDTTIWVGQSGVDGGQATPAFDHGLYGQNQIIAALDTGLDADMCYFYDTTLAELPPQNCNGATVVDMNQRKVIAVDFLWDDECADLVIDDDEWDTQDHGTHVGGIMTGDNYANLLIHDSGDGMAPGAKIVFQDGGYETNDCADCPGIGCPVVDLNPIFQQPYDQGARIHSNSWGDNENASVQNNYTTASEDVDQFMWNNPDFLLFFAAGNSGPSVGSVGSPSTAKNCVSVGATARGSSAESLASFTSYGPTDDNRIKPEVTIPGSGIYSANNDMNASTMNCTTQSMSGTSMACPAAAGLTALIRQYYTEGWYPSGLETPADAFTPTAALLKATLVNSAQEMTGVSASIPANSQGWGRILLDNVLYWDGETSKLWLTEDPGFSTGSSASRVFSQQVVSNSVPFKVTLNWTDYPSTPAASPHLNNDLDLIVEGPGGTTYLGNVFTNGESTTGGSADHLNTLEQVLLLVPTTGVYVITVQAYNIPNGPQPFALVITGDISASSEGLIYLDRFTYNCDDTITITLLDGDIVGNGSQNVIAWSDSEGSASSPAETITLTESPADSGQFIGNVNTSLNTTSGDGAIGVVHGDNITVRYIDADYGGTPNVNVDVTATADCQAPIISNVQVSNITTDSAEITWSTNENADSFVYYGTTPPTWSDESSGVMVTGHSITIAGLSDCTLYYFWVESADGAGNTASDDNSGSYYAFTTQMAVNMFYDDMESGPSNWTAASPWALSTEAYHSSNHAWSDSPGGNYGNNLNVSLTSIPFDLSSTTEANLTFWHTYALESGWDYGYLEISTNGSTWSQLAVFNGTQTEWTESSYDLTTYVGHSNVQIRFRLDSDGYQTMDGWHIDDVSIGYAAPCVPLAEYDSHIFTDDCPAGGAGDADGILDAGETIVFQIDIANIGTGDLTGVWAELSTSTTGVTVTDAQADYNDILEGTSGTSLSPHFTVYLAETIACGTTLDFSLTIHTNEGDFTGGSFSETVGVVVPGDFTLVDEDFESSWGTYGDNPPVGWTIEDYGDEGTPTWNANDWYRYSKGGAYSYIARVYYSPLENQDEWLITPAFTIPAGATSVNLEYDHYFRVYSTGEYGYVDFRSTQNPSWTNLVTYSST
ncbi:S8 family serine peptidase, partial [bacterium]|nr:S8 family serine peptidase [bacterium]